MDFQQAPNTVREELSLSGNMDGMSGVFPGYLASGRMDLQKILWGVLAVVVVVAAGVLKSGVISSAPEWEYMLTAFLIVAGGILIAGALYYGFQAVKRGGEMGALLAHIVSPSISKTEGVSFGLSQQFLEIGQKTYRWSDIGFVRLVQPSSVYQNYLVLQVFDSRGHEQRWKLGRSAEEEIRWVYAIIRQRLEQNQGEVPREIDDLRSGAKSTECL